MQVEHEIEYIPQIDKIIVSSPGIRPHLTLDPFHFTFISVEGSMVSGLPSRSPVNLSSTRDPSAYAARQ